MGNEEVVELAGVRVPQISVATVIVGTGSAAYAAADRLLTEGRRDVVMVTDKIHAGASRNAGSDKQTYYKLTLSGDAPDSVADMAKALFAGGAMDGDNALAEAALSTRCFLRLCDLGVPFPTDRYGQYTGYKTDHDPRERATSIGPYTSRTMTQQLEKRVLAAGIRVVDDCRVVDLVVDEGRCVGLLLHRKVRPAPGTREQEATSGFLLVRADSVVYATGGPAGMYADSVYPHGQWGATGAALRAGAAGKNLTEWQFGLSSVAPRWNVSGSYMQVVPRFVSTDADGNDAREFLGEAIPDYGRLATLVFLKGYQWPFDARKAHDGSSIIDLLVHRETVLRGRRVFLDFRSNPLRPEFDADLLSEEARDYLDRAGVLALGSGSTPVERLKKLNRPAYDFYLDRNPGIDLATDLLEVAVCAQHNNGGLEVDCWWQSANLPGLFPVGEAAGGHGVYRPGGAALNSAQVGAHRAASYIAHRRSAEPVGQDRFLLAATGPLHAATELVAAAGERFDASGQDSTAELLTTLPALMSADAGLVRSRASLATALGEVAGQLAGYRQTVSADRRSRRSIDRIFLVRDILSAQYCYLSAMIDYLDHGGHSRGSVLYTDPTGDLPEPSPDTPAEAQLPDLFRFTGDGGALDGVAQILVWADPDRPPQFSWRAVRPLPHPDDSFEIVWQGYRTDHNID